ncbi:MAG: glutamate 5-kinase [Chitinophagaceae bacterium]|jgi:glutamate 5-kinase|nr:MAG: glutamate 5-kinase [Chitinophagaceae bacterium]
MKKPVLVLKFGSSSLTTAEGEIDERVVLEIARQSAALQEKYNIVIVSSGAVAAGKKYLKNYHGTLVEKKAAAAIGNPLLIRTYGQYFRPFHVEIAQSLCERQHFANRDQFLQLKNTYEALWKSNVIPIANENDVVSNKELKFSDNDELATMIAVGFRADKLLMATTMGGVLDGNNQVIKRISNIDRNILALARDEVSNVGLGGMTSKLNFAKTATHLGTEVVIFNMEEENSILQAERGKTGTVCTSKSNRLNSRLNWLASGSLIKGLVKVDGGAKKALIGRNSLLAVGIVEVIHSFEAGEVFHIADSEGSIFAVAKAKIDFDKEKSSLKQKNMEIAHANDIVLL